MTFEITDHGELLMFAFALAFNLIIVLLMPTFIFSMIKYPAFAMWVRDLIEDGDEKPNTKDAVNAVIIFFAFMIGWLLINMIIAQLIASKDWTLLTGIVSGVFLILLGLKKVH